jgi:acyl dehydratase
VNSCLTVALATGLSVPDTSENATANLEWREIVLPNPVFVGDTRWAEREILEVRRSRCRPKVGIVSMPTRGVDQRGEVVSEFVRSFMLYGRSAAEAQPAFPAGERAWTVA